MTQVIPAFVINLARRPDRMDRLSEHLGSLGVAFERVEACDATQTSEDTLAAVIRPQGPLGRLGQGDRACTVSHAWVWQAFLDHGAPFGLVLEDDVFLGTDLAQCLTSTDWIPPGTDVVKLEKYGDGTSRLILGTPHGQTPSGRALHPMFSRHAGSGAYLISRPAAQDAVAMAGDITVPIDHFLFNANTSRFARHHQASLTVPAMATQRAYGYDSDIAKLGKAARPKGAALRWRKLKRGFFEINRAPVQALALATGRAKVTELAFTAEPPAH